MSIKMTTIENFGVYDLTASQLDWIAGENGGEIGTLHSGSGKIRDLSTENAMLNGGWSCVWVKTYGLSDQGLLILKATDHRTKSILKEGIIPKWRKYGLTEKQCEQLWTLHVPYKHYIAPLLPSILSDKTKVEIWAIHPGTCGAGTSRFQWFQKYAKTPEMPCYTGVSAPVEAALARAIRFLEKIGMPVHPD